MVFVIYLKRTAFEVQLEAFDPTQKIKVIKEVRELFKLGLKEVNKFWGLGFF